MIFNNHRCTVLIQYFSSDMIGIIYIIRVKKLYISMEDVMEKLFCLIKESLSYCCSGFCNKYEVTIIKSLLFYIKI